jgi:BolA protein
VIELAVENIIEEKLSVLKPSYLEIANESHMHSVPANSETHFKVIMVSKEFESLRAVKRHQTIYGLLKEELEGPIHALALHLYTDEEWEGQAPESPECHGGTGK